jgi:hypothetical protein
VSGRVSLSLCPTGKLFLAPGKKKLGRPGQRHWFVYVYICNLRHLPQLFRLVYRWPKIQATHIKIFIDGCSSVKFDWIHWSHNIAVTIQEPTQVTSCCNLLAPVHQLFFNSRSARMSFSQVHRVFIVEHYLASRSYLTCQNEFRDTFPDSPVQNKSTMLSCAF